MKCHCVEIRYSNTGWYSISHYGLCYAVVTNKTEFPSQKTLRFIAYWWHIAIMLYSVQNLGCQRSHYLEHCLAPWQQEGDSNMNHTMDLKVSPQKWYICLDKASHMATSTIHSGQGSAVIPHAKENHKYLINSHMTTTRILEFRAFVWHFPLFFTSCWHQNYLSYLSFCNVKQRY